MARGGVETIRVFMTWSGVEPSAGTRDWRYYDTLARVAATSGMTLLPTFFNVPPFISSKPATLPIRGAAARSGWSSFVGDAARRYGPGGEFWAANPQVPYHPITDWQVWNEPNIDEFVAGRANPKRYAALVKITDQALDSASPGARLGLAGLFRRPRVGYGMRMDEYLDLFYRVRGIKRHFDAVSIHPYSKKPADVIATLRDARRVMATNKDRGTRLWVTELGWTTGGRQLRLSPFKTTPGQQAQKLSRSYASLLRLRSSLKLDHLVWHLWRDPVGEPGLWTLYMGLFDTGGSPKPAWFAFTSAAGGQP